VEGMPKEGRGVPVLIVARGQLGREKQEIQLMNQPCSFTQASWSEERGLVLTVNQGRREMNIY